MWIRPLMSDAQAVDELFMPTAERDDLARFFGRLESRLESLGGAFAIADTIRRQQRAALAMAAESGAGSLVRL